MNVPRLIVVTGRPGAGKTTLAHTLARRIRCPALIRDELKEGFVITGHALPPHMNVNGLVSDAFFQAMELVLRHGITVVAEAAFQHHVWQRNVELLHAIAHIRIVLCVVEPALARTRLIHRSEETPNAPDFTEIRPYWPHKKIGPSRSPLPAAPACRPNVERGHH